jgi:hypothetical protein
MGTSSGYPTSVASQEAWLRSRWPWIEVDIEGIHPQAFVRCLPELEKLARLWPEPFMALKRVKASPDVGWPNPDVRAWYDGNGGVHFRQTKWSDPADGQRFNDLMPHEFGHHMECWLRAKEEMREIVAWFIHSNFELGKQMGEYAATSPREAWAVGFEEQYNKAPDQWHEYTRRQAKLLAPWRMKQSLFQRMRTLVASRSRSKA